MFICKQKCLLLVVCLTVCISTYFQSTKGSPHYRGGGWEGGYAPQESFKSGFSRWPLFIFPCKFRIKSALHVVKTYYFHFAKPASNNIVFYS